MSPETRAVNRLNDITGYVIDTAVLGMDKEKAFRKYEMDPGKCKDVATAIRQLERSDAYQSVIINIGQPVVERMRDNVASALLKKVDLQNKLIDEAKTLVDEADGPSDKRKAIQVANSVLGTDVLPKNWNAEDLITRLDNVHVIEAEDYASVARRRIGG